MKSKALYLIYIFPILFLLSLAACDDMDDYSSDPKHTLWFSQDTLRMDTVLTGIPTSTRQLKSLRSSGSLHDVTVTQPMQMAANVQIDNIYFFIVV